MRDHTARFLGIPIADVKAVPLEIGGGFGAKTVLYVEPVAALLSRKSGHPVKVQMSRKEVFEATGPTSGTKIKVKLGATKEGKLVAAESTLIYEAGAFPGSPVSPGAQCMMAQYDVPNAHLIAYDVVINRPKSAAYRAPGAPASAFAMETAIDELCEKLEMDPMEFRLLNSSKEGVAPRHRPDDAQGGLHRNAASTEGPSALQHAAWKAGRTARTATSSGAGASPAASGATTPARPARSRWSTPTAR